MASDFNRQERWEKEIGGQESDKALPPPERPRCIKGWPRKYGQPCIEWGESPELSERPHRYRATLMARSLDLVQRARKERSCCF
ncbi:hypothetical protein SAMN05518856_1079 [Paenibacillus sp. OK003]|nr:hypothetical protein SAMN05518856_1079 [Paenibacillus sp. OK003]